MSAHETPALLRGAQALANELGEDVDAEHYSEAHAVAAAMLDHDEITDVILTRWQQFAADGTTQAPREFAEQFATDIRASILGDHA